MRNCAEGREVYQSSEGTCYVVLKHRDDGTECEHAVDGYPDADENRARWLCHA